MATSMTWIVSIATLLLHLCLARPNPELQGWHSYRDHYQPASDLYHQPAGGDFYHQPGGEPSSRDLDIGFTIGGRDEDDDVRMAVSPEPVEGHVRGWEPVHWGQRTEGEPEVIAHPLGSRVGEVRLRNDQGYQLLMHVPPAPMGDRPGVLRIDMKATLYRPIYY